MRIILLFFTSLIATFSIAQDTITVISVSSKNKAVVNYSINKLVSSKDTIFLMKKPYRILSEQQSIICQNWETHFKSNIMNKAVYKVYFKNKLVEICSGNTEYYIGKYTMFYKNGNIKISGQFSNNGQKVGDWTFFNKRGQRQLINYDK